jgi:hypothetical protein
VKILHEEKIGEGELGEVFQAEVELGGRRRMMAIKKYRDGTSFGRAEENAARAARNYKIFRQAGLRVFPTFRLGEDGRSILMTLGKEGNFFIFAPPGSQKRTISGIENFSAFLAKLEKELEKATTENLLIGLDAFFFIGKDKEGGKVELDFVFGDFDGVRQRKATDQGAALRANLLNGFAALRLLVINCVADPMIKSALLEELSERSSARLALL